MKLDACRIRLRERTIWEVQDLAFLFLRQNFSKFFVLGVLLGVPFVLTLYGLCRWAEFNTGRPDSLLKVYLVLVAALFLTLLFRLPFLALAADAVFTTEVSPLAATGVLLRTRFSTPWRLAAARLLPIVTVVGLGLKWYTEYFLEEIILLEGLSTKDLAVRVRNFREQLGLQYRLFLAANAFTGALVLIGVYMTWYTVKLVFLREVDVRISVRVLGEIPFLAGLAVSQIYCCVAKFMYYLNLRTIHEGWDLFLAVRRVQAVPQPLAGRQRRMVPQTSPATPPLADPAATHAKVLE
ncbi:MAG: hypothetical protein A3K19_08590 [Lentisphaerae bacterium RIFOXYB12_FULL_65_16]|nr:MAG: hypothetical protein A3K18_05675 [Lentisphaerae bacterium RIFOXYA12_64_32]OGV89473.1 MAG: hypothetical protein A3K19_08590 [Lentisphaerae bacterium RIFOXYB12_FULL_65_16]